MRKLREPRLVRVKAGKDLGLWVLRAVLLCSLLFVGLPGHAQDVQVTATVDSSTIGVNDHLQLTVTVSGKDAGDVQSPRLPRFKGFQVGGGPNVGTQFQWINGRTSSSKTFSYVLVPNKEGTYTLDPVEVSVGGKIYRTQPIEIKVVPGATKPSPQGRRPIDPFGDEASRSSRDVPIGDEISVAAETDRLTVYPGQQITLTYHLVTQIGVTGLHLQENPPLNGFWVEDIQVESNPTGTRRIVNGREYLDYVIKKQALFPNAPGKLKIPVSTFAVSVKVPGNDFFSILGTTQTIYRKTKEVVLDIKNLPAQGKPVGFNNAIGNFTLTASLDKEKAATGDAVSLRVKLAGRGNLKTIGDVPLSPLPDFTTYSSKRTDNVRPLEGGIIGGDKTWEYVIVPKAPGAQVIPPLSFSYFDPEKEQYETVTTPPLNLQVVRGADTGGLVSSLSGISKQTLTRQGTDINFIRLYADDLDKREKPLHRTTWIYLIAGIPLLWNIGAFLHQRQKRLDSGNLVFARSRRARRAAFARLKEAGKKRASDARRFYDSAGLALSGYLTDKFNLPEIAVTSDTLERTLLAKGASPETVQSILQVIQDCDFGRFVSPSSDPERRRDLTGRIRNIIDALEQA